MAPSGAFAQGQGPPLAPEISVPMAIENDLGAAQRLALGLDPKATSGVDQQLGEEEVRLPPANPEGNRGFFARLVGTDVQGVSLPDDGMLVDIRKEGSFPVDKTYEVNLNAGADASALTISWKLPDGVSGTIQGRTLGTPGLFLKKTQMSGCGSVKLTGNKTNVGKAIVSLTYKKEAQPNGQRRLKVCGTDGTGNDSGWRLLALPSGAKRSDLEDDIGADNTGFSVTKGHLLHKWKGGGPDAWTPATSASAKLPRGKGFIMYFFDDSVDPLTSEGLTLDVPAGPENQRANVTAGNLNTGHRFHLLGNPYNTAFSLGALAGGNLPEKGYQATVQVWDPETGQFTPLTQGVGEENPDVLSAWQGFFIERSPNAGPAPNLTFKAGGRRAVPSGLIGGKPGGKSTSEKQATLKLALRKEGGGGPLRDDLQVLFSQHSAPGWDAYEASQLSPPRAETYVQLTSPLRRRETLARRALASEPYPTWEKPASVPLSAHAVGTGGTATLSWPKAARDRVPPGWTVKLEDTRTGARIDLRERAYRFEVRAGEKTLSAPGEARFRVRVAPSPVPAKLAAFEAEEKGGSVRLTWRTARERRSDGFVVQRKAEKGAWKRLGFVESKAPGGTTTEPQTYQFADAELPYAADTLTYRLRLVGTEGRTHLTDERSVRRGVPEQVKLRPPVPNPAARQATLRLAVPKATEVQVRAYDLLGRKVATVAGGRLEAGRHALQIEVGSWATGTYFLRLRAGEEAKSRKLTVIR